MRPHDQLREAASCCVNMSLFSLSDVYTLTTLLISLDSFDIVFEFARLRQQRHTISGDSGDWKYQLPSENPCVIMHLSLVGVGWLLLNFALQQTSNKNLSWTRSSHFQTNRYRTCCLSGWSKAWELSLRHTATSRTGPGKGVRSTNRRSASETAALWMGPDGTRWDQMGSEWFFRSFMEAVPSPDLRRWQETNALLRQSFFLENWWCCQNHHITSKPQRRMISPITTLIYFAYFASLYVLRC